jgi:hypothetical protein
MEQQTISIAKAGIQATLNARASILAAANPMGGRYDKSRPLRSNINLPPAILSRFDLLHVMLDETTEAQDVRIAEHILNVHRHGQQAFEAVPYKVEDMQRYIKYARAIKPEMTPQVGATHALLHSCTPALLPSLPLQAGDVCCWCTTMYSESAGGALLLHLVCCSAAVLQCAQHRSAPAACTCTSAPVHARKVTLPRMALPAHLPTPCSCSPLQTQRCLVAAYKELRGEDAAPGTASAYRITVRQLEALVRLSEAMARVFCSPTIRPSDVEEVRGRHCRACHQCPPVSTAPVSSHCSTCPRPTQSPTQSPNHPPPPQAKKLLKASILKIEQSDVELDDMMGEPVFNDDLFGNEPGQQQQEQEQQRGQQQQQAEAMETDEQQQAGTSGEGQQQQQAEQQPKPAVKVTAKKYEQVKVGGTAVCLVLWVAQLSALVL